jgi:hypothetical protein
VIRISIAALAFAGMGLVACTTSPRSSVDTHEGFPRADGLLSALIGQAVAEGKSDIGRTLGEWGIDEKATPLTRVERRARVIDLLQGRSGVCLPAAAEIEAMRDAPESGDGCASIGSGPKK